MEEILFDKLGVSVDGGWIPIDGVEQQFQQVEWMLMTCDDVYYLLLCHGQVVEQKQVILF